MMTSKSDAIHFCCGCGLCSYSGRGGINSRGYYRPKENASFDYTYCYYKSMNHIEKDELWGKYSAAYTGYSLDKNIRRRASSGGVITEISRYLLSKKLVDEIISVRISDSSPITTEPFRFTKPEDALLLMGSKYTASAPLVDFISSYDLNKRYAVIGKPCDIRVLKNYIATNPELKKAVHLTISFFCGGTPSVQANCKLVDALRLDIHRLVSLKYRGDGWPGLTVGMQGDGKLGQMEYEKSWGKILGRDLQEICRFCWEGVGESADVSCGDGWYIENGKPCFVEKDGRNIIFARTDIGNSLLIDMSRDGVISLDPFSDEKALELMQPGQFMRKASMFARVLAARILFRPTPNYKLTELLPYARLISFKTNLKMFGGTIKRILKGTI